MHINMDEECTFMPNIYQSQKKFLANRVQSSSRYQDSSLIHDNSMPHFQNNTDHSAMKLSLIARPNSQIEPKTDTSENVWERMDKRIKDFQFVKHVRENPDYYNLYPKHDQQTGQELFRPKLVAHQNNHNYSVHSGSIPKWEALYKNASHLEQKKRQHAEKVIQDRKKTLQDMSNYTSI